MRASSLGARRCCVEDYYIFVPCLCRICAPCCIASAQVPYNMVSVSDGCEPGCGPLRKNCRDECMNLFHSRVSGCDKSFADWRRALRRRSQRDRSTWLGWLNLQRSSYLYPISLIPGRVNASPSDTQGGSPVRESRPPGSVRGVPQ